MRIRIWRKLFDSLRSNRFAHLGKQPSDYLEWCRRHLINNAPFNCHGPNGDGANTFTYNSGTELYQTMSQANAAGYSASQKFPYSPTSADSPTMNIANNLTGSCSDSLPLCVATSYGSTSTAGSIPVMGQSQVNRPSSGMWDAGAYAMSSGSGSSQPAAPSGLAATVN